MDQSRKLLELESLNRAFQRAFLHTETGETPESLLSCLGTELECVRICVFEPAPDGSFDNTYEWCASGADPYRELMHALPEDLFSRIMDRLRDREYLSLRGPEDLRTVSPEAAGLLTRRGTRSLLASRLAFRGQELGFFLMENPGDGILADASALLPGIRYILSSLVYNEHLIRHIEHLDQRDLLTGVGNLSSLKTRLRQLRAGEPLGLCYVETAGWSGGAEGLSTEQALIRTGEILTGVFGDAAVFRTAANEFLAIPEAFPIPLSATVDHARTLLRRSGLTCGIGFVYTDAAPEDPEPLIRQIHMDSHQETHTLLRESDDGAAAQRIAREPGEARAADIPMYRTEAFFQAAEKLAAQYPGHPMLTVVLDLNYFKLYNDIFGREAGSRLLEQTAASLLTEASALNGLAGYLGGDNFILFFPSEKDAGKTPRETVQALFGRIPYPDGFAPALGVYLSIDGEPLTAMYDHALTALEEIKGSYVEHFRFYDADRFHRDRDDKLLMMAIREGLDRGEFTFYLQPQVLEKTGRIVGAEALCRWRHKGQLVSPSQFIPTLEKTGTIFEIDCLIWEQVAAWLADCRRRGLPALPVSVNVSRIDFFFTDIAEHFISLTRKYGIPPELLGVEITESAFADNMELLLRAVEKLHEAGFHVLMDDFGNGYSSLSMLHTMNLDVLKTDVRFMSRQESDTKAISIVESIVSMAHMIGMLVITEGIETEAQRKSLIAIGENYAQGFLFYHPMPPEEFEALLRKPEMLDTPYIQAEIGPRNHLRFREMVHAGLFSGSLLDNLIGPAAVLKREDGRVSIQQINEACRAVLGLPKTSAGSGSAPSFAPALEQADLHPGAGVSFSCPAADGRVVTGRAFLLYSWTDHSLYFVVFPPEQN